MRRYEADVFFEDNGKDVKEVNDKIGLIDGMLRYIIYFAE